LCVVLFSYFVNVFSVEFAFCCGLFGG